MSSATLKIAVLGLFHLSSHRKITTKYFWKLASSLSLFSSSTLLTPRYAQFCALRQLRQSLAYLRETSRKGDSRPFNGLRVERNSLRHHLHQKPSGGHGHLSVGSGGPSSARRRCTKRTRALMLLRDLGASVAMSVSVTSLKASRALKLRTLPAVLAIFQGMAGNAKHLMKSCFRSW